MEDTSNALNIYEKGNVLLRSALKKYEEGNIEEGDKDRELANQFYERAKAIKENGNLDAASLYGENRNFGIIYKVITENIKKLYNTKKGVKLINETANVIKSNNILKEQLKVYDTLSSINIDDTESYISEALNLIPVLSKKEVKKANSELIKMMRKYKIDETINIDDNDIELLESIEYVLLNKKCIDNLIDYNASVKVIKENMENRIPPKSSSLTEEEYNRNLNDVIENLDESLNEDEIALLKEINESDKREVFDKYKQETLQFITEQISATSDIADKIDWNSILTRVHLKQFNENKVMEDVLSFVNIKNIIEN